MILGTVYVVVKFTTSGTYSISLIASNSGGSNTKTKAGYLSVTPPAPLVTSPVTYCYGTVSVALTATGSNLKWYTSASGGSSFSTAPTPSTTASGSKTYYVSQTINGFESPLAQINVIVNSLPTAPGVTSVINYCPGAPALPLSALGTNLRWYTSESGGTGSASAPVPSTAVIGTTNYYVSQKNTTNCEGPRAQISVIVKATLDAPTVITPVNYCRNAVAIKLTAVGTGLKWYTTATGGTGSSVAPVPLTNTAGTTPYYVSQTSIGCPEGPRSKIEVITATDSVPVIPTVSTPVGYLQGDTAMPLTADGNLLKWYNLLLSSTALANAPVPATAVPGTTSYYVSQTINNCESQKAKIDVVINALAPAPPWVWGTQLIPPARKLSRLLYESIFKW